MKVKRFSLVMAIVWFLLALIAALPALLPPHLFAHIPFNQVLVEGVNLLYDNGVPPSFSPQVAPLVLPAIFLIWSLIHLFTQKRPFSWWVVPYSALFIYTLFVFTQVRVGGSNPPFLMERLKKDPLIGSILVILALLLEATLFLLFAMISRKLNRRYRERLDKRSKQNRRVVKQPESPKPIEVTEPQEEEPALVFPPIREIGNLKSIEPIVYSGRVKVEDDESILESEEEEPLERYPALKKRLEQDKEVDPIKIPTKIPKRRVAVPPVVTETEIPQQIEVAEEPHVIEEVIEEEERDMEVLSGVGGLASSEMGVDALLTRQKIRYNYPSEDLLDTYPEVVTAVDEETREAGESLIATLKEFKIDAKLVNIVKGPTVTMFEVSPAPGVRVSSIISLSDNIALQLAAQQVRIVAPIPGKQAVGIEVPNRRRNIIGFKDLLPSIDEHDFQVPMVLGRKITGEPVVIEITQTPHLLIAGATGSGKSVCVNSFIGSILYRRSPKEVRLILVDPKIVELRVYNGIPHLLTPVITEPKKTIKALEYCLYEMERRYKLLNALAVRNIAAYNRKIVEKKLANERLPYIVVIIDEFADLMNTVGKELETMLARLAAMARAIGIHLVLATQRPSANVITGIIKSNIPTRIAFMVASQIDSRIIIDETGAEKLLGRGDMLFAPGWDPNSIRIQGAFLSDEEVERIVAYAKTQGAPDYLDESFFEEEEVEESTYDDADDDNSDEALFEKALRIVVERQGASASYLQRRLKIGYNRAARLVEQMEEEGYVGPPQGSKPRELLKFPE